MQKILVIEDDAAAAAALSRRMSRAGFSVDRVPDASLALRLARRRPYAAAVVGIGLLERVRAPARLTAGDLTLDLISRVARRGGRSVELRAREFKLLEFLLRRDGRPATKAEILKGVWGYDFDPRTNVVDVLVCRLRDKIDKPFSGKLLRTVRGVGYVMRAD